MMIPRAITMNTHTTNKKKGLALILISAVIFTIVGQLLGSFVYLKYADLNESVGLMTLYDHYQYTNGEILNKWPYRIGFGISVLIPFVIVLMMAIVVLKPPVRELHGSAKFANKIDLQKAGLLTPDTKTPDILIGQSEDGQYLRWSSKAFAFLAAPTRSGKGVGIVIPNCLHYRESLVVFDPKLENYKLTSGYRKACGQEVFLFNPSTKNFKSHRWNPLSYINRNPLYTVGDAFNVANILYSTSGGGNDGNAKFFAEMAQKLFVGLVLYMIETEVASQKTPTLTYLNQLTTPAGGQELADWIVEQCNYETAQYKVHLSDECKNSLMSYAVNSENTASSILSSMVAPLSAFLEPTVAAATGGDDFDLRDVRKKKMTIYVGINPNDFEKFKRLINLFFSQLISVNTEELPEDNEALKYQCLLLIDEFGAMGKVDIIQTGVAYIAGYNLRLLLIFQNLSQLNELYTVDGARTLSTNFDCQIIYPPRDQKDATDFSDMIGYETYKSSSINRNRGQMGNSSESISDQRRALLLPQELTTMDDSKCVISLRSTKPILGKKIIYYADPVFKQRLGFKPAEIPTMVAIAAQKTKENEDRVLDDPELFKYITSLMLPASMSPHNKALIERSMDDQIETINVLSNILSDDEETVAA